MPSEGFDDGLRRELERGAYATGGETITGTVRGTDGWLPEAESFYLLVSIPRVTGTDTSFLGKLSRKFCLDADDGPSIRFRERMRIPDPGVPLSRSKFGRLVKNAGYDRRTAAHLIGETVECTYVGDDTWAVLDPLDHESETDDGSRLFSPRSILPERIHRPVREHSTVFVVGAWVVALTALGFLSSGFMTIVAVGIGAVVLLMWSNGEIPPGDHRSVSRWLLGRSEPVRPGGSVPSSRSAPSRTDVTIHDGTDTTDVTVEGHRAEDVSVRVVTDADDTRPRSSRSTYSPSGLSDEERRNPLDDRSRHLFEDE